MQHRYVPSLLLSVHMLKRRKTPDPRRMQINLTGFLTKSTPAFMSALWQLLLEAQESPAGVPRTFVEEKKAEMRQAKAGDSRAIEERDRRARLDDIRNSERDARGGARGRGRGRGRGGRGFSDDRGGDRARDSGWGNRGGVRVTNSSTSLRTNLTEILSRDQQDRPGAAQCPDHPHLVPRLPGGEDRPPATAHVALAPRRARALPLLVATALPREGAVLSPAHLPVGGAPCRHGPYLVRVLRPHLDAVCALLLPPRHETGVRGTLGVPRRVDVGFLPVPAHAPHHAAAPRLLVVADSAGGGVPAGVVLRLVGGRGALA